MTEEQRGARLGEGKTKVIYECASNPHQVIIVSKDKLSAGNGAKFDVLPGKAEFSNVTTCNVFRLLNLSGVATHFVQQDSADSMRALNCAMIPLEVIVRRVAAGSYVKRFPTVKEGTVFSNCVVEFTFKDDQHGDPLVTDDEIIDMKLVKNGLTVDRDVIEKLKSEAVRTFEVVEAAWKMQDVTLVDFKVEFGVTSQGQLVLGDVIDNDSWRIWPGGDKNQMKDKQVYRNMTTKLLDEEGIKVLRDNYEWVMKATGRFVDAVPKHQSWSSNVCGSYPLVGVIMGSQTDWETMKNATAVLSELEIPFETRIVSAHRTPDRLVAYAKTAKSRGLKVIIAGAGGAAHLPGMVAAMTTLPVFGVPVQSRSLNGLDSLLSIVQMPGGIPVGTLAIGTSGAQNAGLLAASVIASSGNFPKIDSNLERWRAARTAAVALSPEDNVVNPHSNVAVQSNNNNNNSDKKQSSLFCQLQAIRRKNNSTGYKFPPRLLTPFNTVIGVMGGGQLARMFSLAAANLGYKVHVFTPEKDSPCEQVCAYTTNAQYDDCAALDYFASQVDVITYEFENINADAIEYLEQWRPVYPSSSVLRICQDRLKEKTFVSSLGIPTAKFQHVTNAEELKSALAVIGYPAVLKTNTMGYDGKGQIKIQEGDDIDSCWTNLNTKAAILESFVPFDMEVSVIVAQSPSGAQKLYPVMENLHKNHILDFTYVPARNLPSELEKKALDVASKIAANINLVGLIAVEMFVRLADGEVLVNELAPRPHNSGHWTMDGCVTSQFEQLTRCLCSLPLGSTEVIGTQVVMKNLIGNDVLDYMNFLRQDSTHHADSHLHIYGKAEAREGRKMGHVNTVYRKSE